MTLTAISGRSRRNFCRSPCANGREILAERGRIDASAYQKRLIEAQIAELARTPPTAPVIALGSTGAQPTTARLLAAIAGLENGAVVLPGLDQIMSAERLDGRGSDRERRRTGLHPSADDAETLARGHGRGARRARGNSRASTPALAARRALVSQAMAPADATSAWRDYQAAQSGGFAAALDGVIALEAPDERLEALTLALFMREALETPGRTAALVTPDRHRRAARRRRAATLRH